MRHRLTAPRVAVGIAVAAALALTLTDARGYDQQVTSNLWAEGYSVPARDGSLISRRRIVEDLHLAAWNLLPGSDDPYYDGLRLSIEVGLRLDTDFAVGEAESDPGDAGSYVAGLTPLQLDAMFAYLDARGFWQGVLDVRAGRQVRLDTLGFFAFDGAETALHLPAGIGVATWLGYEVRGGDLLGYDALELDGVDSGGRHELDADQYPDRVAPRRRLALGSELSWVPIRWIDAGFAVRTVGLSQPTAEQKLGARLTLGGDPVRAHGRVVWNPMLDRRDDLGAAFKDGTLVTEADAELAVTAVDALTVSAEYHLYRPTFEADSIFNVFDLTPQNDVGPRVQLRFGRTIAAAAWAFARLAEGSGGLAGDAEDARLAGLTGGVGCNYTTGVTRIAGRFSGAQEWGESRLGVELGGGHGFLADRLWLGLRGSYWHVEDDFSELLSGDILGYVASARFTVAEGARVVGEFENYYGGGRDPRFVALALLQLDFWR